MPTQPGDDGADPPFQVLTEDQWISMDETERRDFLEELYQWIYSRVYDTRQELIAKNKKLSRGHKIALAQQIAVVVLGFSIVLINYLDKYFVNGWGLTGQVDLWSGVMGLLIALIVTIRQAFSQRHSLPASAKFNTRLTSMINHLHAWWSLHVKSCGTSYAAYRNAGMIVTSALSQLDDVQKLVSEWDVADFQSMAGDITPFRASNAP